MHSEMKALGIDAGSLSTKAVVMEGGAVLGSAVVPSGEEVDPSARDAAEKALKMAGSGFDDELFIVSTGMGGKEVSFGTMQKAITTCLARGVNHLFPSGRLVIDMGAESSTVVKISGRGRVNDWANHDKCAAGTGIFLQQMAKLMLMSLDEMADLAFKAAAPADITATCAVFAESEVISHVHRVPPTPKEDVAAGIFASVVSRMISLGKRVGIEKDVVATGGVALNRGLIHILEQELGFGVLIPEDPQIAAALGAAILARENMEKRQPAAAGDSKAGAG